MRLKPSVQPHSLRPVWEDFTVAGACCTACHHTLTSGKATYFSVQGKVVPFGPVCASKYALPGSLQGIPDYTKGITYEQEISGSGGERKTLKKCGTELTQRALQTKEEKEKRRAIYYAILRGERLPSLGFRGLAWHPVKQLYTSYLAGSPDPSTIKRILEGMETNETNRPTRKFSLANLEACYAYAKLLEKIKQEAGWMSNDHYHVWNRLCWRLRSNYFLGNNERAWVGNLAKLYMKKPPSKIRVKFTAFRPEHAQTGLPFSPSPPT